MLTDGWSQKYSVGVREMDEQHEVLLAICIELVQAMERGTESTVLVNTLRELVGYTRTHFVAEERLLELHGFAGLDGHRSIHERLLRQVGRYVVRFAEGDRRFAAELADFLENWLIGHIQNTDRQYAKHLASAGVR